MASRGFTHPGTRRVSYYDPSLSTTYSTGSLWQDCPLLEYLHDPSLGFLLDERWDGYNAQATTGNYTLTQATAGTAAIGTAAPGQLLIDSGDTTAHHGVNLQRLKSLFLPATGKDIWAEFVVKVGFLTVEAFIGLAASKTNIIASGSVGNNDRIGWSSVTGDGVLLLNCMKVTTGTTAAATTLSTSATVRLGFRYDGTADTVQQYINGVATGTAIATTYIPKVAIYPSFVCQNQGTDEATMTLGAVRIFQLR